MKKGKAERDDLQVTAGDSKEDEKKMRAIRFLTQAAWTSSQWLGNADPCGNGHVLHRSSFHSEPNQSLMAHCWEKHI